MYAAHLLIWWSVIISITSARTCPSLDIRNNLSSFNQLEGCERIEGFLLVVLFDLTAEAEFANLSFPLLREVTEYVIFSRVAGLRSIASFFPNLAVIRGEKLFIDYGLVINQCNNLQEINLPRLVVIRGAVAIRENPRFCFADTIDWDLVAADSTSHLILSNGLEMRSCRPCSQCPKHRCWNGTTCQVPLEWRSPDGYECDKECLAGCTGRGPSNCTACKRFGYEGKCLVNCPSGTFMFKKFCITEKECKDPQFHANITRDETGIDSYFTFNGSCIQECPHGYERAPERGCIPCFGMCKKVCDSGDVENLASAQKLRGCTYINGSLSIHIGSGKASVVAKELENSLGKIEEIYGYLKITRASPLVNLNFLKNLRVIHGKINERVSVDKSFIILDNQNLQDLWEDDARPANRTLKILNGRPFFHHNPKLCLKHVNRVLSSAGVRRITENEVASDSNGDQFACHVYNLTVSVHLKYSNSVVLLINQPPSEMEQQEFVRYVAYYKKASANMSSPYDGDECGDNVWIMNDVLGSYGKAADNMNGSVYHSINRLEPDTLYAFYVATYTINSSGAQSPLQTFRTLPSQPGMPTKFMAHSNSSNQIVLRWEPPLKPNGRITKYVVTAALLPEYPHLLENRNYCTRPVRNKTIKVPTRPPTFETFMRPRDSCCDLEEKRMNQSILVCETRDQSLPKIPLKIPNDCDQYWYDLVANKTIMGFNDSEIMKRSTTKEMGDDTFYLPERYFSGPVLATYVKTVDADVRELLIQDVKHYSEYVLTVTACRDLYENEPPDGKDCSQKAIEYVFTQPEPSADDIRGAVIVSTNNRTAHLSWDKPVANGITVSYHVELLRTDVNDAVPQVTCVPSVEADGMYDLKNLPLGDYRVRIKSLSTSDIMFGRYSSPVEFSIKEYSAKTLIIVIFLVVLLFLTATGVALGAVYYYKYKHKPNAVLITSVNPEYCGVLFDDEWELPRDRIKIIKELKRGNFGVVCEGVLSPENRTVAIKKVIDTASSRDVATFMNEAMVMKRFTNCNHIVRLIGVVSRDYPQLVIMEMMVKGDLKTFLRESRDQTPPSPAQMCLMAAQIADGMAYLEAEKFVHRDLAARNCMVSAENVVKIGDFGMTRDVYETDYYRKGNKGLLPIRWMAPESLNDGVFSSKSDVWSYGVVLWEIITLASQPYQGMSNEQVLQYVIAGNKLDLPPVYPKRFKPIMCWCWKWKPKFRPSFIQILMEFEDYMTLQFRHMSYYYTAEGILAREACLSAEQESAETELVELDPKAHCSYSRTNGHAS